MAGSEEFLGVMIPRHIAADEALYSGDPEPRIAMWSAEEPVTLFSAGGESISGPGDIFEFFHLLAARYSTATDVTLHLEAAEVGPNLAYTVGIERFRASLGGSSPTERVIRATQIYRRDGYEWKIVHRHGASVSASPSKIRHQ